MKNKAPNICKILKEIYQAIKALKIILQKIVVSFALLLCDSGHFCENFSFVLIFFLFWLQEKQKKFDIARNRHITV